MKAVTRQILIVAYGDARLTAYLVSADRTERGRLDRLMQHLRALGHVANFTWQLPPKWDVYDRTVDAVAGAVGRFPVEAALASPAAAPVPPPAWLMPVWPFDYQIGGLPASTADLMGSTLEMRARPCADEERGVVLPGRHGRWWIEARTIGADQAYY